MSSPFRVILRPWFADLLLITGGGFLGIGLLHASIVMEYGPGVILGADMASACIPLVVGIALVAGGLWRRRNQ